MNHVENASFLARKESYKVFHFCNNILFACVLKVGPGHIVERYANPELIVNANVISA